MTATTLDCTPPFSERRRAGDGEVATSELVTVVA